jgi:parallel beta-helix repeat protein
MHLVHNEIILENSFETMNLGKSSAIAKYPLLVAPSKWPKWSTMHKIPINVLLALVLMLVVPVGLSAADVILNPGDDIQAAVKKNPAGTTFVLNAGTYRLQKVVPKNGNIFQGRGRNTTILTGAKVLTGWTHSGSTWYVTGQTQQGHVTDKAECEPGYPRCDYPEGLWIDNVWKLHVAKPADVGPGKWFFDYAADRISIGDDPTGHTVETSVTDFAFVAGGVNVKIRDITIEKYATASQRGAVHSRDQFSEAPVSGWVIDNCEIRQSHGNGVHVANNTQVLNSNIHHNGNLGIGGGAPVTNTLIQGNEISFNNVEHFNIGWQSGGVKLADGVMNTTFRNNYVHDNYGVGLWCDHCSTGQVYEGNRVENNYSQGIFHEVSADAIIRNNTVRWNGHERTGWLYDAQIMLSSSWNVEVYGNTVQVSATEGNAITIVDQDREDGSPVTNNYIHDNLVIHDGTVGLSGADADYNPSPILTDRNRFVHNTYCVPNLSGRFWNWGDEKTWAQWQSVAEDAAGAVVLTQNCPSAVLPAPTKQRIFETTK